MQTGPELHALFAVILLQCLPNEPVNLWNRHKHQICDDLHHYLLQGGIAQPSEDQIYDYGLFLLESIST
ncbi:hypothetical protein SERLA73DRAFT_43610 [Serpula lacrymans var. lacrymans S7.3]|uniref:Uncharacterized protein n=1 Tax=Serpula lacrymans var. lacrymans (strain S7.3) TaxID=936435 RepID=F8PGK2_SERL3|nr:hypothetical protein SERLA73DRAFT_43610 [Serpula lacrymans var. lacrymans S7.3]